MPFDPAGAVALVSSFATAYPLVVLLLGLVAADIAMGLIAAVGLQTLNSTTSWRGMSRKAATVILVAVAYALEPHIDLPSGKLVTMFYCATEALSTIENAALLGAPVPEWLRDVLYKLKEPAQKENVRLARERQERA